ncbi:unnamed protein product [Diatraea saccharalis]|uniref:Inactive tRNA-specific adenosine deaminase-like protein 3 n=1 Tax=Diatraea saccharalis TaxID=40085 RepID=A0A9N9RDB6_9NEOP|nr:unnamed protein product [Diatraea saccharalis]
MEEEPCHKKLKLDESVGKYVIITNYIDKIQNSLNNLKAIVSDDLTKPVEMINMHAGCVKQRKDISKVITILNEKLPLTGFQHLKRVRGETVIICPTELINSVPIEEYVEKFVPELMASFQDFIVIQVPKCPLKLKRQYAEINRIWSCNFHPDTYLEKLTGDNFFSEKEVKVHRLYMSLALQIAIWYYKTIELEVLTDDIFASLNVTVIIDPSIDSVVAIGIDNSMIHPVQHSTMIAIDNVAKTQNGGAWNSEIKKTDDCVEKGLFDYLKVKFPKINIGAKKYLNKEDLINDDRTPSEGPYLCTNYYVYMLREPCLMCAMALVHARAKRVFFCFDKTDTGALRSQLKLHTVSSLNHHYEAFTCFL